MHKIKRLYYRRKLLRSNFFEGVNIKDLGYKNYFLDWFLDWIIYLYCYKKICIFNFKEFFSKYEKVVFPITIVILGEGRLIIEDNMKKEYYFFYDSFSWNKITTYSIGRRTSEYDKEYTYEITTENKILLKEVDILEVDENGKNKEDMLSIQYEYKNNTTKAILKQKKTILQVEYTTQDTRFDNQIIEYLFYLSNNGMNADNVYNIFVEISKIFKEKREEIYLNITSKNNNENNKKILSQIALLKGFVTHYTFTERKSDEEMVIHYKNRPMSIKKFMHEN